LSRPYTGRRRRSEGGERKKRGEYGRKAAPSAKLGSEVADNVENPEDGFADGGFVLLKRLRLN